MHKHFPTLLQILCFIQTCLSLLIKSLRPSDSYMHQKTWQSLVQIMGCRLFGAKPLSDPMMVYCQLDPKKRTSLKYYLRVNFHSGKCSWKYCEMAAILSRPQCVNMKTSSMELLSNMYGNLVQSRMINFQKENWQMKLLAYMQWSYFKTRNSISTKQCTMQS